MEREYWENDNRVTELLLESKMSVKEIAEDIKTTETFVHQRIKALGLDWILHQPRKISRGQTALTHVLQKILPNEKIVNEFHIGERLKLDIYCPTYNLAIEYHGRQHFEFIPHFHATREDFIRAQERDDRKIELCKEKNISLIAFRYCDNLSEEVVYNRLLEEIKRSTSEAAPKKDFKPKRSITNTPGYEEIKAKRNAYQRELRRKIKQEVKENEKTRAQKIKDEYDLDETDYL